VSAFTVMPDVTANEFRLMVNEPVTTPAASAIVPDACTVAPKSTVEPFAEKLHEVLFE